MLKGRILKCKPAGVVVVIEIPWSNRNNDNLFFLIRTTESQYFFFACCFILSHFYCTLSEENVVLYTQE